MRDYIKKWKGQVALHLGGKNYVYMRDGVENETYLRKQIKDLQKEFRSMANQPINIIILDSLSQVSCLYFKI